MAKLPADLVASLPKRYLAASKGAALAYSAAAERCLVAAAALFGFFFGRASDRRAVAARAGALPVAMQVRGRRGGWASGSASWRTVLMA